MMFDIELLDEDDEPVARWIARADQVAYRDLSAAYQKAIAQYMSVDGEAWAFVGGDRYGFGAEMDADRFWADHLAGYVAEHGHRRFAVLELELAELAAAIMAGDHELRAQFGGDWDAYHAWYQQHQQTPDRGMPAGSAEIWPVVLDSDHPSPLQDGWHRLHDYVQRGLTVIPAFGYLDDEIYYDMS